MKAERCDDVYHKAWNPSEIETQASCLQVQSCPLLSWIIRHHPGSLLGKSTRDCTWAGQECSKLSLVRKVIFVKGDLFLKGFLSALSQVRAPYPKCPIASGRRHPPRLHEPQLRFSAACCFFPLKSFKRSHFCLLQNGKHLLKCQEFFTSDASVFFLSGPVQAVTLSLLTALALSSAENSCILHPTANLELKRLGNCTAASLSLICQCGVCINAANLASGCGSLNSPPQPQE